MQMNPIKNNTYFAVRFPEQFVYADTRKIKPFCILMRQEVVGFCDGSGISFTV